MTPPASGAQPPKTDITVLVTRASHQADGLAKLLVARGAQVVLQPVIEIVPPDCWQDFDLAIAQIQRFSRLVFVSTNAVRFFFLRLRELTRSGQFVDLDGIEFVAIGSATAQALSDQGVSVELIPCRANSDALADLLIAHATPRSTMVLRANRGSDVLPQRLGQIDYPFEQLAIYQSRDLSAVAPEVIQQMEQGLIDWTTITSSAIGKSLHKLFGAQRLKKTQLVSISPKTTATLGGLGLKVSAQALVYNMQGLVDVIPMPGRDNS